MATNEERSQRRRTMCANRVIPEQIRNFFTGEEHIHRQTYFVLGLLFSNMMTEYVFSVLITYLTEVWGLHLLDAVLVTNLQEGIAGICQICLAYLADFRVGNFWLLFWATIGYCTGLGLLSYSYPNHSDNAELRFPFFLAMCLITIGQSGTILSLREFSPIRDGPNPTEGMEQNSIDFKWIIDSMVAFLKVFKEVTNQGEGKEKKFIDVLWIIILVVGSLIGSFALPYVTMSWERQLLICAGMMAASFFIYWLGTLFYPPDRPNGSPLSSVRQVIISAFRNRRPSNNQSNVPQNVSNEAHMTHLKDGTLRCLNNAIYNCEAKDIEEAKHFIKMLPISMTLVMFGIVKSIGSTFFLEQGYFMDSTIGSIKHFPLPAFVLLSDAVEFATSKIYDLIMLRRKRSTDAIKIGIGLVISMICCIVAAVVETKRLKDNATMSVFWLTPQFVLLGAMTGLARDGIEGFFDHQAPKWMKRYEPALAEGVFGLGTILSLGMIFAVNGVTGRKDRVSWFQDEIDSSHLDYFYYALAVIATTNLFLYYIVARTYSYKQDDNGGSSRR